MPGATSLPGGYRVTLSGNVGKNAALIEEELLHTGAGRIHIGVVHPERPFGFRDHDLGTGKDELVVLVPESVDMIGMEM
jgi:hypothetical protein